MEKLLGLVGLAEVKRKALAIYKSVLADAALRQQNIEATPITLNFAFVGNPGTGKRHAFDLTGKTVVATLFAELLQAAGVRAGNRFLSMPA